MPLDLSYEVKIGSQVASSGKQEEGRLLISLMTQLGMDGGCGYSIVEFADSTHAAPSQGDEMTVDLDGGEGVTRIFSGEVDTVETIAGGQKITALDGISKLGRFEIETAFEQMTLDAIVKDLMQQAQAKPGTVDKCPKVPSFVLFKASALRHIQRLGELCGKDLYSDGEGLICFTGPETKGAEHEFEYGVNVLDLQITCEAPTRDGIEVWGEGAAGSQGADKYYWLSADLDGLDGKAAINKDSVAAGKEGKSANRVNAGELRSGEAASDVAEARMRAVLSRTIHGRMSFYGSPSVLPGDSVKVKTLPENHSGVEIFKKGGLRVRNVQHVLSLQNGFVTRLGF